MIEFMKKENLNQYAILFKDAFNSEPWNEKWTIETASKRIDEMMSTSTFLGMAKYIDNKLAGVIFGRSEQNFDGVVFQIQEFFVDNKIKGQGIGTSLLNELTDELKRIGIKQVVLLTIRGEMTEGFYNRKGFTTLDEIAFLTKEI